MARTKAAGFPPLVNEPGARGVGEVGRDDPQRLARDEAGLAQEEGALGLPKIGGHSSRCDFGAPQNFVGHPITDAGEAALQEEDSFDRRATVTIEEAAEEGAGKGARADLWEIRRPPFGMQFAVMKADSTKKARVAENECAFALTQNEVVVLPGVKIRWLNAHGAAHAEMEAEPVCARELEEHLFPASGGAEQLRAGEAAFQCANVAAAEDALLRVQIDCGDTRADACIPLAAEIFHLGEFRHRGK